MCLMSTESLMSSGGAAPASLVEFVGAHRDLDPGRLAPPPSTNRIVKKGELHAVAEPGEDKRTRNGQIAEAFTFATSSSGTVEEPPPS